MTTRKALRSDRNSAPPMWLQAIEEGTAGLHKAIGKITDRVMDAVSAELVSLGLDGSLGEAEGSLRSLARAIVKAKTMDLVRKLARAPDMGLADISSNTRAIHPKRLMSDDVIELSMDTNHAGQILDGAKMIASYMVHLGFADMTEKRVFHWAADGRLPVKKIGNRIVANKPTLLRHFGLA